ncbi:MAG: ABC transporter ATP-binding protein [Planctomycetota bacterium]
MTDTAIKVENLSKQYIIGRHADKGDGLRHVIQNALTGPLRWAGNGFRRDPRTYEEFWALDDISFEVGVGEVIGIIGRNGAGKSTLLKVLSRITEQTKGRITLRGRMASLLEVGTGFHPELTGRENIYLNGAVLGMTRVEIKRKFDEIVEFAEVAKFLDTPVKRYSSGMYVRLAFAVAAHLEPEILVVDEVLAVGDMDFQRKCLGKMDEVSKQGRTVLFVSHNMATIARLCDRSIMLKKGQLLLDGPTDDVISEYLAEGARESAIPLYERADRLGNGKARLTHVEMLDEHGRSVDHLASGHALRLRVHYRWEGDDAPPPAEMYAVVSRDETVQFVMSSSMSTGEPIQLQREGCVDMVLPSIPLASGLFALEICLASPNLNETFDAVGNAMFFEVVDGDFFGSGKVRPNEHWKNPGVLVPHTCESQGAAQTTPVDDTGHRRQAS